MPIMLNIFDQDAFGAATLTVQINNAPFTPNLLGSLGLFAGMGCYTIVCAIEELNGTLTVISTSPRGAPPEQSTGQKRKIRDVRCIHFAREAVITADEVAGVRAFGSATDLQTAEQLVAQRIEGPVGLRAAAELTFEHYYLGAIDGVVYDADGTTVLYDWFDFFGLSRVTDNTTNFGALTADDGTFEVECTKLVRTMTNELQGLPVTQMRPVALCGDNYFDQVYSNKEVKAARKTRDTGRDSDVFAQNKAYASFEYGGITFVNYRGTADGKVGVPTNEGRLFPMGVPGLFQMHFAPADTFEFVNTLGLPLYMLQRKEKQTDSRRVFEVQSNPLPLCIKPRSLRRLKKS